MLIVGSSKRWLATLGLIGLVACSKHRGVADGAVTSPTPSSVAGSRSSSAGASAQAGRSAGRNTAGAGGRVAGRGAGGAGAGAAAGGGGEAEAGQSGGTAGASEGEAGREAGSGAAGSGGSAGAIETAGHGGSSGSTAGNDGNTAGVAAGSGGTKADGGSGATGGPGAAGMGGSEAGTGGTDSAQAGNGAAGSAGDDALGDTPLIDITTQEQATAVCARVGESTANARWGDGTQGICAQRGILAEMSGQGTCAAVQAACVMEPAAGSACTPESLVDCADVTVSEYVACRAANIKGHLEYSAQIDCSTVLANLPPEPTPAPCEQPYARCPALHP